MRQVPLERDINIAVNGCSGLATSSQKRPFKAMLISRCRGTYLIITAGQDREGRGRPLIGRPLYEHRDDGAAAEGMWNWQTTFDSN